MNDLPTKEHLDKYFWPRIKKTDKCWLWQGHTYRGAKTDLHAHHPDYSKPAEVITLCRSCHERTHHNPSKGRVER